MGRHPYEHVRQFLPGLRLQRDRLNEKIARSDPDSMQHRFWVEERDQLADLIRGFISIGGDPGPGAEIPKSLSSKL